MKFIAEFCQNHNGDFDLLKKMIEEAGFHNVDYHNLSFGTCAIHVGTV